MLTSIFWPSVWAERIGSRAPKIRGQAVSGIVPQSPAFVDPFFFTFRHACFRHNRFWTPVSPTRLHTNNASSHHIGADHSMVPTPLVTYHRPVFIKLASFTFMMVASPQFYNAIYVMGGDTANPSSVYIYDASTKSWSTQSVTTGSFDPTSFDAILDHDTNVFCMHLLSSL
jgi:hypothetical protein